MKLRVILRALGLMCFFLAVILVIPLLISYYNNENVGLFGYSIATSIFIGILLMISGEKGEFGLKEATAFVVFTWILFSILGSLPLMMYGFNPIDSLFETVSGFTTTGASVIDDVESLPFGILFWRSLTHWLGGLGIIILVIAILPSMGGGMQLFRAESTGPLIEKETTKTKNTAIILLGVYILITLTEIILLKLAGMTLFDSFVHSLGTVATGGFSSKNASIGNYDSLLIEGIIMAFMFIASINFLLLFGLFRGDIKKFLFNREMQLHLGIIVLATSLITINLNINAFTGLWDSIRVSLFHVIDILSTTGFSISDFNKWPAFSKFVLFILMFIGGCAGSTSGSIKNIRWIILFKYLKRELKRMVYPSMVQKISIGKNVIDEEIIKKVFIFVFMYMMLFVSFVLVLSYQNIDNITAASAVATTMGGIGPGFNLVGPSTTYSFLPVISKITLIFAMIFGRLEIFGVLLIFMPSFWKK